MQKSKPFFSIITCTKDSGKLLPDNIKSVANQTCSDYEHVFIDGKSQDETLNILADYKKKSEKVHVYTLPPKGIANAMNEGIKKARGRYIIHLHSDDSLFDNKVLRDVKEWLENHSDLDWIYGKIRVIEEDRSTIGIFPSRKIFQLSWKYLLQYFNYIPHQAVFIKPEVFEKHGYFNEKLISTMDQELWLRIRYKTKWKFCNRVIANYTIHSQSMSSSLENKEQTVSEYRAIQKTFLNPIERSLILVLHTIINKYNKMHR